LKAKFGVCTELWLIVKRWYPVLTESFDIVCNDDCKFQDRTSQACSGQNICIFETTRGTTYDCVMPLSKGGRVIVVMSHSHPNFVVIVTHEIGRYLVSVHVGSNFKFRSPRWMLRDCSPPCSAIEIVPRIELRCVHIYITASVLMTFATDVLGQINDVPVQRSHTLCALGAFLGWSLIFGCYNLSTATRTPTLIQQSLSLVGYMAA
jgi:hypothetical protein